MQRRRLGRLRLLQVLERLLRRAGRPLEETELVRPREVRATFDGGQVFLGHRAGRLDVAVAGPLAEEVPGRPVRRGIALGSAADPQLGPLPVLEALVAPRGADHRPARPGLRRRLGVFLRVRPAPARHQVVGELDPDLGVLEPGILGLGQVVVERRLPALAVAAGLIARRQPFVDPQVGADLHVALQVLLRLVVFLPLEVLAAQGADQGRGVADLRPPGGDLILDLVPVGLDQRAHRVGRIRADPEQEPREMLPAVFSLLDPLGHVVREDATVVEAHSPGGVADRMLELLEGVDQGSFGGLDIVRSRRSASAASARWPCCGGRAMLCRNA